MIRFVLAGLAWLLCVGGVATYMYTRDAWRQEHAAPVEAAPAPAPRQYDLELTLTFSPQPDPYALVTTDAPTAPLVTVQLNGTPADAPTEGVAPGKPWVKQNIEGVLEGSNELLVEAAPPVTDDPVRQALRLRVLSHGEAVADETFWSEGGEKIIGVLPFQAAQHAKEDAHGH